MLLISMEARDWHITTTGFGITAVNDAAIRMIEDNMVSKLSDGDYYDAFSTFCEKVDFVAEKARNGDPYEPGDDSLPFNVKVTASVIGGIIAGFFFGFVLSAKEKAALKQIRRQHGANAYIYGDASHLTVSEDRFIRTAVTKTLIERDDDRSSGGGGGSTTHYGSSGTMHGGGGGKF